MENFEIDHNGHNKNNGNSSNKDYYREDFKGKFIYLRKKTILMI